MTDTVNLGLPCIEGSQAQKHVTHNDALRILDTLVQLAVLDRDLTAPPGAPAEGQRFIVKAGATGAWAGHDNAIAAWQDGAWIFSAPQTGWVAFVVDEGTLLVWNGTAWGDFFSTVTAIQNLARLGIGTTADATNPLSAKLNNALFAAKTVAEGGDGNLHYTLSKESAAKSLSFLFQDNYSGRAEIGLTGDDDFHFKVSPDGSTWYEGLRIDRANGKVSFPASGGPREVLSADRTYYVRTDGDDANTGLANTSGGAWATLQHAADVIFGTLDLGGHDVTVQVADGSYTGGVYVVGAQVGAGRVYFVGNIASPQNVIVSGAAYGTFMAEADGFFTVKGFEIGSSGLSCLVASRGGRIYFSDIRIAAATQQIRAEDQGLLYAEGNYSIVGSGGQSHWVAVSNGIIRIRNETITLVGTLGFGTAFAWATTCGVMLVNGNTFSGAATGKRYQAETNSVIQAGGVATYLPGDAAGTTATGGQYA